MKNVFAKFMFAALLMGTFTLTSCQKEFEELPDNNDSNAIEASSATATLIKNTSSEEGQNNSIECIDFVYPIDLFSFNINLEITNTVTVNNDTELRLFFTGLGDNDVVGIDFPITLEKYDGTKITINSNAELVTALEAAKDSCDSNQNELCSDEDINEALLGQCKFKITNLDGSFFEELYVDFSGNNIHVYNANTTVVDEGNWSLQNGTLQMNNLSATLANYEGEWKVIDCGDGLFKLKKGEETIVLTKSCEATAGSNDEVANLLKECVWSFTDANDTFIGVVNLKFLQGGEVKFVDENGGLSVTDRYTSWEIDAGAIIFYNANQELISERWKITQYLETEISLDIYNNTELEYQNVLKRDCNESAAACSDADINDALLGQCKFKITNVDGTFSEELLIDFSNNNIHVYDANNTVVEEGNWSLQSGTLSFNNLSMTLANYGGEWKVIECADGLFKLEKGEETLLLTKKCD
ncbi:hypothetical protein I2486_03070 [Cellulophaga sp. E16_2]|uniref:hypothetical protein n=1 Tax=Cellulophaga sp. E16_2 TaxID=2789297 RepID=UPI001A926BF8|nr:hypothetical protein [Cellulophaga sp. E16_2]MBO0590378.1 hypothetical protein [Cellulophaga sp. E16_2]